jgi:hypothetical protein
MASNKFVIKSSGAIGARCHQSFYSDTAGQQLEEVVECRTVSELVNQRINEWRFNEFPIAQSLNGRNRSLAK